MKVKIYHYEQLIVDGKFTHDLEPRYLGYAEVEKFDAEGIFHLCNWSHWTNEKPQSLHANICSCNHGLCLVHPETKEKWLALFSGWLTGDDKTIAEYVKNHQDSPIWM